MTTSVPRGPPLSHEPSPLGLVERDERCQRSIIERASLNRSTLRQSRDTIDGQHSQELVETMIKPREFGSLGERIARADAVPEGKHETASGNRGRVGHVPVQGSTTTPRGLDARELETRQQGVGAFANDPYGRDLTMTYDEAIPGIESGGSGPHVNQHDARRRVVEMEQNPRVPS